MTDAECQQLKANITEQIERLELVLGTAGDPARGDSVEVDLDRLTVSSKITDQERSALLSLKQNLRWLDTDSAGYCDQCGEAIPFPRLQAMPVSRLCISCA